MRVFSTRTYERAIRKLLGGEARREMEESIVAAPDAAPVIQGTGGIRKLRWASSGRGKRGGIRTIYFTMPGPTPSICSRLTRRPTGRILNSWRSWTLHSKSGREARTTGSEPP